MEISGNNEMTIHELSSIAQTRAALCSFLNLHFMTLLDSSFIEQVRAREFTSLLQTLAVDASSNDDVTTGANLMSEYLWRTNDLPLTQVVEELGVDRTRLYRSVIKGYGPPPPYEMVWSKEVSDYSHLSIIAGAYEEAGLSPSPDAKERFDYIGMELEFLSELASREAVARENGAPQDANNLLSFQYNFLTHHFGQWVPDYIEKAMDYAETDFYKGHLLMLRGFINQQKEELAYLVSET
jgi:putative dimethyl sulfoxide reductase chaperone